MSNCPHKDKIKLTNYKSKRKDFINSESEHAAYSQFSVETRKLRNNNPRANFFCKIARF